MHSHMTMGHHLLNAAAPGKAAEPAGGKKDGADAQEKGELTDYVCAWSIRHNEKRLCCIGLCLAVQSRCMQNKKAVSDR